MHHDGYDAEISNLEALSSKLKEERKILVQRLGEYKSFHAPIRRLPVEVLSLIFFHACYIPHELPNSLALSEAQNVLPAVSKSPFLLSSICHSWRCIVLGIPSFWCNIVLALGEDPDATYGLCEIMHARSSKEKLRVYIVMPTTYWGARNMEFGDMDLQPEREDFRPLYLRE
jgi:hypothetical protein